MGYPAKVPVRFFNGGEYAVINGKKYVPERTCKFMPYSEKSDDGICSKCGAYMYEQDNYCPRCGAHVKEDADAE